MEGVWEKLLQILGLKKLSIVYAVRMVVAGSELSVCLVYTEAASLVVHDRNKGHDQMMWIFLLNSTVH